MFKPSSSLPPVVYDADPADYHTPDPFPRGDIQRTMSRSELWKLRDCPLRWILGAKEETNDAMKWGSLIDTLYLTPERFDDLYVVTPDTYPCAPTKKDPRTEKPWNWNADHCKDWRAEHDGKECITPAVVAKAQRALEQLKRHDWIASFREASKTQVALNLEWHDEPTGLVIPFKALLDLVPDPKSKFGDTIADFKTTGMIGPREWSRHVFNFGLFYQAGVYLTAINAATGLKYRQFENVIQEESAPYLCTHRPISDDFLQLGWSTFAFDMHEYCRSLETGKWRGLDCAMVEPEAWMLAAI